MTALPLILLRDTPVGSTGRWLLFRAPLEVVAAREPSGVPAALAAAEAASERGLWAAGFLTYEASAGLDPALVTRPPGPLPCAWFGLFRPPEEVAGPQWDPAGCRLGAWRASLGRLGYRAAIAAIHAAIARGDTYQVNFTFRLRASFEGDPAALFSRLWSAQEGPYSAYVDMGDAEGGHALCSASPELLLRLEGRRLTTRPMKGTALRGRTLAEDRLRASELRHSTKERAENVMIVDLMRNDLGRVAEPGSVAVTELFAVERYDTVFQLTSTVVADSDEPPSRILGALFPAASVTGAPKRRTMEVIAELEAEPRGIYTGAIGTFAPGRRAQFSVAIRTAHVDRAGGRAEYGTGGGIVWDSRAGRERRECRAKALVLVPRPRFELLETLLWRPGHGYALLERHLERLADSALYFGFPLAAREARRLLDVAAAQFSTERQRVRLLASPEGTLRVESEPLAAHRRRWRVALDRMQVDASDRFLFHKTTWRPVHDAARARFPSHDDVLLWNRRGELTESTLANLVLRVGGELLTPPIASGLLAGVARAELLARGRIREQALRPIDLTHADAILLVNSVRGWVRAELDPAAGGNPRRRST